MDANTLFHDRPSRSSGSWDLCVFPLSSGPETMGLAVYSSEDRSLPHVGAVLPHVAHALKRLKTLAEQEDRNRRLEAMVRARTVELTQANEWLQAEVEARRAAEAEVLQVSEFERRRFGLDLHDDICQRLAGLTMYLRGFQRRPPESPSEVLAEVGSLVEETLQLTRQYAHASFPIELERRGLESVLRTLCETVATQNSCPCRFSSSLDRLDPPWEGQQALNVYRIIQEALQNAVKHSRATQFEVSAEVGPAEVVLKVVDNGSGIAPAREGAQGLGLRSMAYRATQLGARFDLTSRPGLGTVVEVAIPRVTEPSSR